MQFRSGKAYEEWAQAIGLFHEHFYQRQITPIYEESWNEPDLTESAQRFLTSGWQLFDITSIEHKETEAAIHILLWCL